MVKFLIYLDVYQEKFKDLFDLNDNITHQLEILKQKIVEKDNEIERIKKDNREYIDSMFVKNAEINNILKNEVDNLKLELTNSNIIIKDLKKN